MLPENVDDAGEDECVEEITESLFAPLPQPVATVHRSQTEVSAEATHVVETVGSLRSRAESLQLRRAELAAKLAAVDEELRAVTADLSVQELRHAECEAQLAQLAQWKKECAERDRRISAHRQFRGEVESLLAPVTQALGRERKTEDPMCGSTRSMNVRLFLQENERLVQMLAVFLRSKKEHVCEAKSRLAKIGGELGIMRTLGMAHNLRDLEKEKADLEGIVRVYGGKVESMRIELVDLEKRMAEVVRMADFDANKWGWGLDDT